jgi:hypothetical protein
MQEWRIGKWVTRVSSRGHPYRVWEVPVPRIPDQFLKSVVYLYPSEAAADDGERIGGTGFIVGVPVDESDHRWCVTVVVTNRHIIDNGNMVVRLNTKHDGKDIIPLDNAKWFFHPAGDDLAACLIELDKEAHEIMFIPPGYFATKDRCENLKVGPGDDVFVVGRFISREGKQKNLPSVRFGSIAQMPGDPIMSDGFPQESYLVEARSIPGYSGSPVFLQIPAGLPNFSNIPPEIWKQLTSYNEVRSALPIPVGPWLLGIDFCHIFGKEKVFSTLTGKPVSTDWHVRSNSGMMGVIPVWKLEELLETSEMKTVLEAAKKRARDDRAKNSDQVSLDAAVPPATDVNPTHREDFNSLLGAAAKKPEPKAGT